MPAAEVDISADLVRGLLAAQHPDLAPLPVWVMANGWDNLVCRLGSDLIVRLPRRELAAELVRHEQRWLPELAPSLPLPIPAPVRVGQPGLGYPWAWSIVPFLPGSPAALDPPADMHETAVIIGSFLSALHTPAATDAPANPFRGVPLGTRSGAVTERLTSLGGLIDQVEARRVWEAALAIPPWQGPPIWLHGDLHPANILVSDGRVSGVIDFGDITAGDPAGDLSVAWMLLPAEQHSAFRDAYDAGSKLHVGEDDWSRAKGWALAFSLAFLANSADNEMMAGIGRVTLDAVLA